MDNDLASPDLQGLVGLMPFAAHLGIRLIEATPERVVAELDHAPNLCTAGGIMHGGALMALGDSVGAVVTFLGLPEGASHLDRDLDDAAVPAGHRRHRPCGRHAGQPGTHDGHRADRSVRR